MRDQLLSAVSEAAAGNVARKAQLDLLDAQLTQETEALRARKTVYDEAVARRDALAQRFAAPALLEALNKKIVQAEG